MLKESVNVLKNFIIGALVIIGILSVIAAFFGIAYLCFQIAGPNAFILFLAIVIFIWAAIYIGADIRSTKND